ncbi:hypothetical protein [Segetibacter sp.]|jgi:hypothetical protein|uniref:hypothetical protein n=1 Tax=Segetibacter sp. TaxID=2231182 RepID=UPI002619582D|nr:hypothetical protein [Segetibacter sp.]MCW3081544.1 hypothetical protein [Segetibacter sp.]
MKANPSGIVKILEKEKCGTHKYRALIYLEKQSIKINACCDSFKYQLEERSKQLLEQESVQLSDFEN